LNTKLIRTVFVALFAALICVSSFWTIPLLPALPIVLKNLVIVLAGAALGTWYGAAAAALYLLLGVLGMPVFVNAGGIAAFLTPAGGYMAGYVAGSLAAGLVAGPPSVRDRKLSAPYCARIAAALFLGFLVILVCGSLWLLFLNARSAAPKPALAVFLGGILPFAPADSVKFVLSIPLAFLLRPLVALYAGSREK